MAFFNSSNPVLKESTFNGTIFQGMTVDKEMTIKGTANKFLILLVLMLGTTIFSWNWFYAGNNPLPLMITGVIGCLILGLLMSFKTQSSPYLAPAYALLKGLLVGSVSAYYDFINQEKYPGLVMQAVALTLLVAFVMYLLYINRIIKVTQRFRSVIIIATSAIFLFYLIKWIAFLAFGNTTFGAFTNAATPLGIGFSILVVCLAALFLLIDFDMIEKGVESKAPKFMEWYGAFALLVTLVWLYLEILRLLSKLRK
jgi:uncharacterized YccA/Bax inhibitor family protein